jgi:hypothetical protein
VSDHLQTSLAKIVQLPSEWWKLDASSDIQMKDFKKLSEVDQSVAESKSDNEITIVSKSDEAGLVVDMVEEEEIKGY